MGPTTTRTETSEHHGGRSLDASRDVALREAALELLAEVGYDRMTIDAIAARARAGKPTIYRRWRGKAELVVDALNARKTETTAIDTGSLRGDLEEIARTAASRDNQFDGRVMIGLVTALAQDAELRQVFRARFIEPHGSAFKGIFERAVARGEVSAERNLDLLVSLFPALALQHLLIYGKAPDAAFARQVVQDVILPLATAPSARLGRAAGRR